MVKNSLLILAGLILLSSCFGGGGGGGSTGENSSPDKTSSNEVTPKQDTDQALAQKSVVNGESDSIELESQLEKALVSIDESTLENAFKVLNDEENFEYSEYDIDIKPLRHFLRKGPKFLKNNMPYQAVYEINRPNKKNTLNIYEINLVEKSITSSYEILLPERLQQLKYFKGKPLLFLRDSKLYEVKNGELYELSIGLPFNEGIVIQTSDTHICQYAKKTNRLIITNSETKTEKEIPKDSKNSICIGSTFYLNTQSHLYISSSDNPIEKSQCTNGKLYNRNNIPYLICPKTESINRRIYNLSNNSLSEVKVLPHQLNNVLGLYNIKIKNHNIIDDTSDVKILITERGQLPTTIELNANLYNKSLSSIKNSKNGFLLNFSSDLYEYENNETNYKATLPFSSPFYDISLTNVFNRNLKEFDISTNYDYEVFWQEGNSYLNNFVTENYLTRSSTTLIKHDLDYFFLNESKLLKIDRLTNEIVTIKDNISLHKPRINKFKEQVIFYELNKSPNLILFDLKTQEFQEAKINNLDRNYHIYPYSNKTVLLVNNRSLIKYNLDSNQEISRINIRNLGSIIPLTNGHYLGVFNNQIGFYNSTNNSIEYFTDSNSVDMKIKKMKLNDNKLLISNNIETKVLSVPYNKLIAK